MTKTRRDGSTAAVNSKLVQKRPETCGACTARPRQNNKQAAGMRLAVTRDMYRRPSCGKHIIFTDRKYEFDILSTGQYELKKNQD